jgi:AI-2 transport protein TqsA
MDGSKWTEKKRMWAPMPDRASRGLLAVIAVILTIWLLRITAVVTLPLTFALLTIAAVWPLRNRLCRWLPEWLSLTLAVAVLLLGVGAFALAIYVSSAEVLGQVRSSQSTLNHAYRELAALVARHGIVLDTELGGFAGVIKRVAVDGYTLVMFIAFVVVLVGFGLSEVVPTRRKLRVLLTSREQAEVADTADEIVGKVRRYLSVTVLLSALTGLACWAWGYAVGLQLAVTWGLLNFLLNFVPIAGNIIGIIPPSLYALGQFGSTSRALLVFAGFAVIQFVISNFLNPWLQGRSLSLSPFAILLSIAFWGWLWGIGGALIAVPLTSAAAIICAEFQATRWVAALIARKPLHPSAQG